jgi:sulfate transport system ATP-binding protein
VSLSRHETEGHHAAEVRDIRPLGATTRVTLKVEGQSELIEAEVVKDHDSLTGLARARRCSSGRRSGRRWRISEPFR